MILEELDEVVGVTIKSTRPNIKRFSYDSPDSCSTDFNQIW